MEATNRPHLERLYRAVYTEVDFRTSSEAVDKILLKGITIHDIEQILKDVLSSTEFKVIWYCYGFEDGKDHNIVETHEYLKIKEATANLCHNAALTVLRIKESLSLLSK